MLNKTQNNLFNEFGTEIALKLSLHSNKKFIEWLL